MKKFMLPISLVIVTIIILSSLYVYSNFKQESETTKIDQSTLNEQQILQMLDQSNTEISSDTSNSQNTIVKSGSFNRFDPAHYANGQAKIFQTDQGPILKLENFETNNGPDLFVYLATEPEINSIKANLGQTISLGRLKQITGDQVYQLPDNYQDFNSVVIWCRAFDINFSVASLETL